MSNAPLVVLISAISPNPDNIGGPSGLPWEIVEALKHIGYDVQTQVVPLPTVNFRRRMTQLSLPSGGLKLEREDADVYIVYPFYLCRLIPPSIRSRTILLGPDATSMLYSRIGRIQTGWQRWRAHSLARWFVFQERWAAKHLASLAVVGRNDLRWLRWVSGVCGEDLHYIPHPVLSHVARPIPTNGVGTRPRVIFAGDLSNKYVGDFFYALDYAAFSEALRIADSEVLVVGKGNHAVYDLISSHVPSQYLAWVEDYATLCDPLRDVHVIPLMAGAGTKNRMLTALSMNVIVVSTPIGYENIALSVLRAASVHRFRSSADFPLALAQGLSDLKVRRTVGSELVPPPIANISIAFQESLLNLVNNIVAKSRHLSRIKL